MNPSSSTQTQQLNGIGTGTINASAGANLMPVQHQLPPSHLQTCAQCDAPLDALQRYCLNCGTRSQYVSNPAVSYIAEKSRSSRLVPKSGVAERGIAGTGVTPDAVPWIAGAAVVALLIGMFLTGVGGGNDDLAKVLAAQKAPVINVGAGPSTATAAATPLTSDFSLDKGFAVQLQTIPSTSDQAAADAAKQAATGQGAADVGLINPTDFTVDPAPANGDYVIYSGEFKKKGDANKALKKLKAKFPEARVISVAAAGGSGAGDKAAATTGDVALDKYKPSAKKQAADKKEIDELNNKVGDDYVKEQEDLDPVTVVPGQPTDSDPNKLPGGD